MPPHTDPMSDITPFKGRIRNPSAPIRVLHRFTKPGHWAEIRERIVTDFRGVEFLAFLDGELLDSQFFPQWREHDYPEALATRIKAFVDGGWIELPQPDQHPA